MNRILHLIKINWSYLSTTFTIVLYFELILGAFIFLYNPFESLITSDKFVHFYVFSLLSFVLYFIMSFQESSRFLKKNRVILTVIIAVIIGTLVEFVQFFMPTRSVNIYDWISNLLGSLVTVLIIKLIPGRIKKMRRTDERKSDEERDYFH